MHPTSAPVLADRLVQSSQPDRLWSRSGTASEIHPSILSPMCWSFWEDSLEFANRTVFVAMGVLPKSELRDIPADPNQHAAACFYGRLAVNVDRMRDLFGLLPGVSADDFERDFLGSVRPNLPSQRTAWGRLPIMAVRLPIVVKTVSSELQRAHDDAYAWWKTNVLAAESDDPLRQLEEAKAHFATAIGVHIRSRFLVQIAQSALAKFASAAGDLRLANDVVAGLGGTVESAVAEDLWRLAHDEITLDGFLGRHGYHGPYESHMYTYSWRERPERVSAMAASFARRTDVARPTMDSEVELARIAAATRMVEAAPRIRRPVVKAVINWSRNLFRNVQLGHASYAMCIDGGRFAARGVGRELVERGLIDEVDDVFFLTIGELKEREQNSVVLRDLVARRRAQRIEFESLDLPRSFIGNPDPIHSGTRATGSPAAPPSDLDAAPIRGLGVRDGTVIGRARVLIDIDEDIELDDGDILVCCNTDPSWTSIMSLASGLVVDMGGSASHAAIVAREMGIVCVVGTGNGTRVIPEGATIKVDGTEGAVTLLAKEPTTAAK